MSLAAVLEDFGYSVTVADCRVAGVQAFQDAPIDLVLTDLQMPDNEGLDVIHKLREHSKNAKIVAMSGVGQEATSRMIEGLDNQDNVHALAKPVRPDQLLELVRGLVG